MSHISNPFTGPVVTHTQEFSGLICAILGAVIFIMYLTGGVIAYGAVISSVDPFTFSLSLLSCISFAGLFYRPFLGFHIEGELQYCFLS